MCAHVNLFLRIFCLHLFFLCATFHLMETNNIFDQLESLYGGKNGAAAAIGVCKRTYDYWRAAGEITQLPAQRLAALLIAINHMPQRTRKRWLQ